MNKRTEHHTQAADVDRILPDPKKHKGRITAFYHFYEPDDVAGAVHFADLCEGLFDRDWSVTMMTSNRYCRYDGKISVKKETIAGVKVNRRWRPGFNQARNILRMVNSFWIQLAWMGSVIRMPKPDFFIVGTDPQFSQFMLPLLRLFSRRSRIVFWVFDLYPEAIQAEVGNKLVRIMARVVGKLMPLLYRPVDVMVDIGPYMRDLLRKYGHSAREHTLVPWAVSEPGFGTPVNDKVRASMFGEGVRLGLLYSGNMGMAHEYENFLSLAKMLRDRAPGIVFAFSARGNRVGEMEQALAPEDRNVKILPFANQDELEDHLNAADIHLLSLREKWAGIVVPSKFFGALAAGKPVLYSGAPHSCIGQWIVEHDLGLVIGEENISETADKLIHFSQHPEELEQWKKNAYQTYHERFSKQKALEQWSALLEKELATTTPANSHRD